MVLESYIESLVNRFCGRWLTDFTRDNLEINMVEGKVHMHDIVVNTHELEELCLLFTPRRIYLGSVYIQIPLNAGRPLKIQVTDALVLIRASTTDTGFFDVRKALQSHINLLKVALESQFRALAACTTNLQQFVNSASAKTSLPVIQNLELTITNLHVRIEDTTVNTHVPLAFGVIIKAASVTPGGKPAEQPGMATNPWRTVGPEAANEPSFIDKLIKAEDVGVYADSDNILSLMTEEEVIETMRTFSPEQSSLIMKPVDLSAHVRYLLRKNKIDIQFHAPRVSLQVLHDQLHVMLSWLRTAVAHMPMLQRHTLRAGSSVQNSAALRWRFAINAVLADLRAFRQGGWRNYLRAWVMASRYQTVRAMLHDYVAVVSFTDSFGTKQERFYENLEPMNFENQKLTQIQKLRLDAEWTSYMLPYELPAEDIAAAWALIKEHTTKNLTSQGLSHRGVPLSPRMVQCLYAIQLELDATLPPQCSVFLRLSMEHRLRHLESFGPLQNGQQSEPQGAAPSSSATADPGDAAPETRPRLLLALAHGEAFKPLMANTSVDAFCRLTLLDGGHASTAGGAKRVTDSGFCKYDAKEGSARWHQLFQFSDLSDELAANWLGDAVQPSDEDEVLLQLDCFDRMAFMDFSIGSTALTRAQLLSHPDQLREHDCTLGAGGGFMGSTSITSTNGGTSSGAAPEAPKLKLLSFFSSGKEGEETKAEAALKRGLSIVLQRHQSGGNAGLDLAELNSRQPPVRRTSSLANGANGGANEGDNDDETGGDPWLMAFPRMSVCLRVDELSLTVGIARYQELQVQQSPTALLTSEGNAAEEEEESGRGQPKTPRYKRRRTVLVNVVVRGIQGMARCWPEQQEGGKRVVLTDVELQLQGLTTFHRQSKQGEQRLMPAVAAWSDVEDVDVNCVPLLNLGATKTGLHLCSSLPENLTTVAQVLTWVVTIGVGDCKLRITPRTKQAIAEDPPSTETLYSSERFFLPSRAIAQILSGILPAATTATTTTTDDSNGALQQTLYLALVTGERRVQFEFETPTTEDMDSEDSGGLLTGPITMSEDYVVQVDSSTAKPEAPHHQRNGTKSSNGVNGHHISKKKSNGSLETLVMAETEDVEELQAMIAKLRHEVQHWRGKAKEAGAEMDDDGRVTVVAAPPPPRAPR